jgi:hypothetical protein
MRTIKLIAAGTIVYGAVLIARPATAIHPTVTVQRLPAGGIQPEAAVGRDGTIHVVYFRGRPDRGDALYIHSLDGVAFSLPMPVNSIAGSVIATGSVRGPQIAVGRSGRVHVAWNGSHSTAPGATPMFYARLNETGTAFEPQRNVMHEGYDIDGGGAVAADRVGRVYVVWHANAPNERGEGQRRIWVTRSIDDGQTFEREHAVFGESTGACGCCGLGAFAHDDGSVFVLFRSAFEVVHRDMYLLTSRNAAASFSGTAVDRWNVGACVMSTQAFGEGAAGLYTAWETEGQVYLGRIDPSTGTIAHVVGAPGVARTRKHPAIAVNRADAVLLAWTEDTAWNKGGSVAWQVFDANGAPVGPSGRADGVPVWGLVAAFVTHTGGFSMLY